MKIVLFLSGVVKGQQARVSSQGSTVRGQRARFSSQGLKYINYLFCLLVIAVDSVISSF